ncbi:MAG: hypothetical protein OZ917_08115 [Candidatus Brocadiaceae bacterium]|nr:hypothetical protein [Candidatus Brocadiaceae bacterium]
MVNHGWRELKTLLGWRNDGRLAIFCTGLTFLAVVVAWVFFRADNFPAAWRMLSGMTGINGVSLPYRLANHMSLLTGRIPHPGLVFIGLASVSKINGCTALIKIALGLGLVWFFPGVRYMLENYQPTWENVAGMKTPSTPAQARQIHQFRWKPTPNWAVAIGILFFITLLYMASNKASEFLYFQF